MTYQKRATVSEGNVDNEQRGNTEAAAVQLLSMKFLGATTMSACSQQTCVHRSGIFITTREFGKHGFNTVVARKS